MKRRRSARRAFWGYVWFFLLVASIITAAAFAISAAIGAFGENRAAVAAFMLAVVLFLSFVCATVDLFRRKITVDRPLGNILDAAERISAGDFSVRLPVLRPPERQNEFDLIMQNMNVMAEELSRTEILRGDFVANVSHEFKTPLAVIRSYAEELKKGEKDSERVRCAETIAAAARKLTDLVSNVLALDKLENGQMRPETCLFRLDEQLAQAVLAQEEKIEQKNLRVDCDLEELTIRSAPELLEIVWNNLLSNAVKFTPEGGSIALSLHREGDNAVVRVADTGCGIPAEAGEHIFEKFYQADRSRAQEGNGLGLALVKRAIGRVGGEITAESEPGKGSIFTVRTGGVV